jgi:hypothetical protein
VTETQQLVAWRVREGDQILMPDDVTWCTVERIWRESDTGRLFFDMGPTAMARPEPCEMLRVRRGTDA